MDIKRAELKDVWKLVPAASAMGLSGSLEGRIRLTRSEKGIVKSGIIRLVDVEVSPENAGWGLSKVRGPLEIDNDTLQIPEVNGRIKRSVEAPFKVKGKLNHLESLETVNGRLSFELAQGTVKPEVLKFVIPQEQGVLQNLLRTGFQISGGVLDLTTISATFQIQSGVVRTEDFKAKAQSINLGAIGSLHLANQKLDALACVQTTAPQQAVEVTARVLGRIPEVQKLVKQNEGWLKAIGLDKELKRYGIVPPPDTTPDKATQAQATVTPSTIMVRLNGPLSKLEPGIVWESALDKTMITRLKALAN